MAGLERAQVNADARVDALERDVAAEVREEMRALWADLALKTHERPARASEVNDDRDRGPARASEVDGDWDRQSEMNRVRPILAEVASKAAALKAIKEAWLEAVG